MLGGIPQSNLENLEVLQAIVPDILNQSIQTVRPGYVRLIKSVSELTTDILEDRRILAMSDEIRVKINKYIENYWDIIRNMDESTNLLKLMEEMLDKIKDILSDYKYVDVYGGYQVIAEIWKKSLTHDAELIANEGFYKIGRTREPNMVTKGSGNNRREEQDGWIGSIVPNDLIAKNLYSEEMGLIEHKRASLQEIEAELTDLAEAAKVEDSDENNALENALKRNDEDEPGDTFDGKLIKSEIKKVAKGSQEFELLKKVESLLTQLSQLKSLTKPE